MSAQTGDRAEAFRAVYEANYGAIHAYAVRRVGVDLADEVAAETFLVAWRRFNAALGTSAMALRDRPEHGRPAAHGGRPPAQHRGFLDAGALAP